MRRIKSVAVTIPCIAGPYSGVHATLTLLRSRVRTTPDASGAYGWAGVDDPRFAEVVGPAQSIATSTAQADGGVFELNHHDDRPLPFEGRGTFSEWRIVLDPDTNRFDLASVTDVLLQLSYTAREGGELLRAAAKAALPQAQVQLLSARHDFSDAWYRLLHPTDTATYDEFVVDLSTRLPFVPRGRAQALQRLDLYLRLDGLPANNVPNVPLELYADADPTTPNLLAGLPLVSLPSLDGMHAVSLDLSAAPLPPGKLLLRVKGSQVPSFAQRQVTVGTTVHKHLDPAKAIDLHLVAHLA